MSFGDDDFALYEYDVWNQMITARADGTVTVNTYNGDGLRVEKTTDGLTTHYGYEYSDVVLEICDNQATFNLRGLNLISRKTGNDTVFFMYNGHGDVVNLTDGGNTVIATYYYDAFGVHKQQNGGENNPYRYSGYTFDSETGLYCLKARFYDPLTSRMLSEDSYYGDKTDPLSLNLYTYVSNNPIRYWDPTGYASVTLPDGTTSDCTIKDGVTTLPDGSRPPVGAIVHADNGLDYQMTELGYGVEVPKGSNPATISTPEGTKAGTVSNGVTNMTVTNTRPEDGWIVTTQNGSWQMNASLGYGVLIEVQTKTIQIQVDIPATQPSSNKSTGNINPQNDPSISFDQSNAYAWLRYQYYYDQWLAEAGFGSAFGHHEMYIVEFEAIRNFIIMYNLSIGSNYLTRAQIDALFQINSSRYLKDDNIKKAIANGDPIVFAFEGVGSYSGQTKERHEDGRYGAMMVVVKNGKITYITRNASTLPDKPQGANKEGQYIAILKEGVYRYGSGKHKPDTSNYAALRILNSKGEVDYGNVSSPVYRRGANSTGYAYNIHAGGSDAGSVYSEGCQIVYVGDYIDFGHAVGFIDKKYNQNDFKTYNDLKNLPVIYGISITYVLNRDFMTPAQKEKFYLTGGQLL